MKRHLASEVASDQEETAKCLLLFSHAITTAPAGTVSPARTSGYECKTCSRKFTSFQALGGHRASHKRLRFDDEEAVDGDTQNKLGGKAIRGHECSICGLEFAIGQALGGHMRRHRKATARPKVRAGHGQKVVPFFFDLNLPPMEDYTTPLVLT